MFHRMQKPGLLPDPWHPVPDVSHLNSVSDMEVLSRFVDVNEITNEYYFNEMCIRDSIKDACNGIKYGFSGFCGSFFGLSLIHI